MKILNFCNYTKNEIKKTLFIFISFLFYFILIFFIINHIGNFYIHNFGVKAPLFDYFCGWCLALLLSLLLIILPIKFKNYLLSAWFLKVFVIFFFDYIYESHYKSLDMYMYFNIAKNTPSYLLKTFNDTHNMVAILSYLYILFPTSSSLATVFCAFIGLIALYIFYKGASLIIGHDSKALLMFLLFTPSLLFWSSILGKDPIVLFLISLYFLGLAIFIKRTGLKMLSTSAFLIIFAFIGFIFFRFWLIGIFGISLFLSFLVLEKIKNYKKVLITIIFMPIIFFTGFIILHRFHIYNLQSYVYFMSRISHSWAKGGSAQNITFSSFKGYLIDMPFMIFTALFRPLIWDGHNLFQLFAGLQNTVLLIFFIYAVYRLKFLSLKNDKLRILLINIFVWSFIYAPISFQNLGTANRFEIQILPFIITYIFIGLKFKKLPINEKS